MVHFLDFQGKGCSPVGCVAMGAASNDAWACITDGVPSRGEVAVVATEAPNSTPESLSAVRDCVEDWCWAAITRATSS